MSIAVVLLCLARPVVGQGTFGSLPDPISSRDMERYGERLGLSEQQMLAIAEHHGHYLESFRNLREGDIQRFLDDVQTLAGDFDFSQRREVEQLVRTLNNLMQRVRNLDERLFDELLQLLTEDQASQLPRVRLERERSRFNSEMTRGIDFLNPAVRLDLSAIIHEMNLSPEVVESVDPLLESYERRLTRGARQLFDTTTTMILDALKRLEEMGFTEGSPRDPEMALQLVRAFQDIWSEITADLLKEAGEVATLQRNTYRQLAGVLPRPAMRELRRRYYRRAYPEAATVGRAAQQQFEAALAIDDLTARQREDIASHALSHWQAQDRIADQIIELLESRRRDITLREVIRRDEDERQARIDALREQADEADEVALGSLYAILGEELAERVRSGRISSGVAAAGGTGPGADAAAHPSGGDPFIGRVPGRISYADIHRYAERLGLDDNQRVILESMHEDYQARYRDISEQHLGPLRTASQELAAMGEGVRNASPRDAARVAEIFAMQREALEAVRTLDATFFADMRTIIEADQSDSLERLQLRRERSAYIQPHRAAANEPGLGSWGARTNESNIDLSSLIDELQLSVSFDARAHEALIEYERKATELFREKYEAELQVYRAMQTVSPLEDRRRFRRIMGRAGRVSREVNQALAGLNRASFAELRRLLDDDAARYLEHYYRRAAFPDVFDDPHHAEDRIAAGLELAALSDSQRAQLRELALDYRGQYAQVADRMYEIHESYVDLDDASGSNRRDRGERAEMRNELARLRFERNEINDDAQRRLRAILSDEQIERLGL